MTGVSLILYNDINSKRYSDTLEREVNFMTMRTKRTMVTLLPEWEPVLDQLKKEKFYNDTQAEMLRFLIGKGIEAIETESTAKRKAQ